MRRLTAVAFLMVSFQTGSFSKTYSGVEYSRPNGQSLVFDARVPDGAGPFPIAIVVHGGAWVTGDRKHSVQPLFEPILNSGIACFSISYRLAQLGKGDSLPNALASAAVVSNAVEDVRQAVGYIRAHAAEYNVDPARIVLVGESAGAQLASMAALKLEGMAPVQGVVAFYSPSDLAGLLRDSDRVPDGVRTKLKGTPLETMLMNLLRTISPIGWVRADAPPFLLIHGTRDQVVPFDQSVSMCKTLRDAGASCDLYAVEGGRHGLRWWESTPGLISYKAKMAEWLRARLSP